MSYRSEALVEAGFRAADAAATFPRLNLSAYDETAYNQLIILTNPASRRGDQAVQAVAQLRAADSLQHMDITEAQTSPNIEGNMALLEALDAKAVIVVYGGDGAASDVANAAQELELENPLLILPGGGKNDLAYQLNESWSLRNPVRALTNGRVAALRPIDVRVSDNNTGLDIYARHALAYFSFGASAEINHQVNHPDYRKQNFHVPGQRWLAERAIAYRAIRNARPFMLSRDDQAPEPAIDGMAINGKRMYGTLHPKADLLEPAFRFVPSSNRPRALGHVASMMAGLSLGDRLEPDDKLNLTVFGNHLWVQSDGESEALPDDCRIELSLAAHGLTVVTDRRQ
ncbi:MAG: diacylglycerol/lipid kinase family protein [Candidatus Saccharimonadales bacterium]